MKPKGSFVSVILVMLLCAGLTPMPTTAAESLGKVHFPVSCTSEAQRHFDRTMALYHSFYWPEVKKGFDAVLKADPGCVMAYWGHAMALTGNPFLWPLAGKNLREGLVMIGKAKAGGARTQRERDYIAALELFYKDHDKLDHKTRVSAYERAMRELAERYSDDIEARILYALVLSATFDPSDKTYAKQLKAAEILEKLFKSHPDHPGVSHYLIHSYDYPPIADRGLAAARRFAKVAPSAPHALHMPAHIFTRLGYWQESIASNIASANSRKSARSRLHPWDYMTYAYLQTGQDAEAKRIVTEVAGLKKMENGRFAEAYALAAIPVRYSLERGQWSEAAKIELSPSSADFNWKRFPQAEAVNALGRGLGAARSGDVPSARAEIERINRLRHAMLNAKLLY